MNSPTARQVFSILCVGLSLSIGWGIRGNFGHENGAMIPGALATLAGVLLSGREDWLERCGSFGFFGALGWSFGGSISYMQVIAYTHSGHSSSVLYGFACLFVIGFLWAAMGGAGAALPAFLSPKQLAEFFPPVLAVFAGWVLQDVVVTNWFEADSDFRQRSPLYWYDTDWLGVLVAISAVALLALIRRRIDLGTSLILHMAIGWWLGFLVLVIALGWRMTPPRGDNWAGCIGMVGGMWVFFYRQKLRGLTIASLISGMIGGFGFATANLFKLLGIGTGWQTNWHNVLEQSYGFINGIGLALALLWAAKHAMKHEPPSRPGNNWETFGVGFVLLVITYLNFQQDPQTWVKAKAMPEVLLGLKAGTWFSLAYMALAVAFVLIAFAHRRAALPLLGVSALARTQLLYLLFLWWVVIGNFLRAVVSFAPQRLITEGIIFLNAVLCTVLIVLLARRPSVESFPTELFPGRPYSKVALASLGALALSILADWGIVRAIYGEQPISYAGRHIRFGPDATASIEKPSKAAPHP